MPVVPFHRWPPAAAPRPVPPVGDSSLDHHRVLERQVGRAAADLDLHGPVLDRPLVTGAVPVLEVADAERDGDALGLPRIERGAAEALELLDAAAGLGVGEG